MRGVGPTTALLPGVFLSFKSLRIVAHRSRRCKQFKERESVQATAGNDALCRHIRFRWPDVLNARGVEAPTSLLCKRKGQRAILASNMTEEAVEGFGGRQDHRGSAKNT